MGEDHEMAVDCNGERWKNSMERVLAFSVVEAARLVSESNPTVEIWLQL